MNGMFINYLIFPQFNPIMLSIGPVSLYWYGFMYFLGFIFALWILVYRITSLNKKLNQEEVQYLLYISFLGLFIGGRIGYIILYQPLFFYENPLCIFKIWEGGMSFHGGLIGIIIVWIIFSYYKKVHFFHISDCITPVVPFGLALGRLGNFINGELYGRVAINIPWAMLFPNTVYQDFLELLEHPEWQLLFNHYGALPRHPSQLYEMFFEGILLFCIINIFARKPRPVGSISGIFLFFYGIFRILIEYVRQPDIQLGLFFDIFSMGQILSIPMIIAGVVIIIVSYNICFNESN